ncbi:metallophosphoesterase [Thioalkalicoccus limnaeus]|uniref:Metallophosphoesterase n=1 Tax=Thioalkalicoccus limnaeus TaxID=120681 RepID=A0ABV4BHS4_9GAMM
MATASASPGRLCPVTYRTRAATIAKLAPLHAHSVFIVGGLYGNLQALDAIEALAAHEVAMGLPQPQLVVNGDFHWFDAEPQWFADVQRRVSAHAASLGNVEAELIDPQPGAGCGCAYPASTPDQTVAWSNAIIARLQEAARRADDLVSGLRGLPPQRRLQVGDCRIGVVHGDPDSLAGWGLELDAMPPVGHSDPRLEQWFREADVDLLASSHTCRCFAQGFPGDRAVFNNGSAGMPDFKDDSRVMITRVARHAAVLPDDHASACRTRVRDAYIDAILVPWDREAFLQRFDRVWPPGSPAMLSYRRRITDGPDHHANAACRVSQ